MDNLCGDRVGIGMKHETPLQWQQFLLMAAVFRTSVVHLLNVHVLQQQWIVPRTTCTAVSVESAFRISGCVTAMTIVATEPTK